MEYNRKQHEVLLGLAKKEIEKQKLQATVDEVCVCVCASAFAAFDVYFICKVDEELNEWLKKNNTMKQKKKQLGRKEKESIWKAIEARDSLIKKLDRHS